jgi:putative ABC transport system permease protein
MFLIAVVSIVEGMSRYVEEDFAAKIIGKNTFSLRRRPDINVGNVSEETWREYSRRPRIYEPDVAVARGALPPGTVSAVENMTFAYANSQYGRPRQVQVIATESDYFRIKSYNLTSGRVLAAGSAARDSVVVIGTEVASHSSGTGSDRPRLRMAARRTRHRAAREAGQCLRFLARSW